MDSLCKVDDSMVQCGRQVRGFLNEADQLGFGCTEGFMDAQVPIGNSSSDLTCAAKQMLVVMALLHGRSTPADDTALDATGSDY